MLFILFLNNTGQRIPEMMKKLLLILCMCVVLQSGSVFADGFLKTSGKKIVNASGNEVFLQGINLGGWLVQEGYLMQTSSFANSATEIRAAIENLVGAANADEFYRQYYANYVTKKDIQLIAEWGFNSIRLPLHYKHLSPKDQPGVYLEEGFKTIDSVLSWCEQYKVYLILDLHAAPGAQNTGNISDSDGEARLWTEPANQTRTVELWGKIAQRYVNKEWIGGYDLINETAYNFPTGNNKPLRDLMVNITTEIRKYDKNHIVYIEGNWYATDFNSLTPAWDNNMVYSFHKYWNQTDVGTINYLLNIRNQYNVPLWLGETGENSNQWFVECIELMKANNIGYCFWPHKKFDSVSGPVSVKMTPEYQRLLDYWKGNSPKPSVDYAKSALLTMAQNTHIDKCQIRKDVLDAMFRQVNNTATAPFTENNIPGIIYAVNYDMGKNGFAYSDKSYKNVGGAGGGATNNGYVYRNDGVDIEACSDAVSNGYNVGWIEAGDWMSYTVNIKIPGTYIVRARVAGGSAGGKIILRLDGVVQGYTVDVPATGGWQSWKTIALPKTALPAGIHTLKIQCPTEGFNLNYLEFELETVDVERDNSRPLKFGLEQNYPNPFNPSTTISYSLASEGYVSLKVFDLLGNEISTLVNEVKPAGNYRANFNATGLPSGIYFYQLKAGKFTSTKKLTILK